MATRREKESLEEELAHSAQKKGLTGADEKQYVGGAITNMRKRGKLPARSAKPKTAKKPATRKKKKLSKEEIDKRYKLEGTPGHYSIRDTKTRRYIIKDVSWDKIREKRDELLNDTKKEEEKPSWEEVKRRNRQFQEEADKIRERRNQEREGRVPETAENTKYVLVINYKTRTSNGVKVERKEFKTLAQARAAKRSSKETKNYLMYREGIFKVGPNGRTEIE